MTDLTPYTDNLSATFRGDDSQQLVILETEVPHLRMAVATTSEGGLQVAPVDSSNAAAAGPVRATDQRYVSEVGSFLAELHRRPLNGSDSQLWGSMDEGRIIAVYDEHGATGAANWRQDRLMLELRLDEDWKRWHALSGKWMDQEQFGDTIEELLHTVTSPDQADLMEVIMSVRASTKGEFESSISRSNGSLKSVYSENVTTKAGRRGELEVPELLTLSLTPWEGHLDRYDVGAYLRLRVAGGDLALSVKLKPTRQILRRAWDGLTAHVVEELGDEYSVLASTRL